MRHGQTKVELVKISLAMALVATAGCSMLNDYRVSGGAKQTVDLEGIREVTVECYCRESVRIHYDETEALRLDITGELSSVGYHGRQSKPATVPPGMLRFSVVREGDRLTLSSSEYTYIHHAFIIERLGLAAPRDVALVFHPLKWGELEGRD